MRNVRSALSGVFGILLVSVVVGAVFQAPPSQVAYYEYEEAAGPTANDSSPTNADGTHMPGVQISAIGDCAPVPGTNQRSIVLPISAATGGNTGFLGTGAFVSTPDNPAHNFTGPFTMAAWIKPAAFAAGNNPQDWGAIIFNWNWVDPPGVFNGYGMDRRLDGRINFHTGTTAVMETQISNGTVPLNVWTHVAAVFDGANKRIYINGVQDIATPSTLVPGASTAPLQIGKDDYWRNFYGNVDEVRLFNVALTQPEVAVLHAGMAAPTGLAATPGVNQISLTWNPVTGATSYTVYQSTTPGTGYVPIGTPTGTTFTATGIAFPTRYYYVVVANGIMTSAYSNEVNEVPLNPIPRTNDHDEGLMDGKCACGSASADLAAFFALLVPALLIALRRR